MRLAAGFSTFCCLRYCFFLSGSSEDIALIIGGQISGRYLSEDDPGAVLSLCITFLWQWSKTPGAGGEKRSFVQACSGSPKIKIRGYTFSTL